MSEKEKPKHPCDVGKFKPFTREEFAKATYGSNKYWFAKHYSIKWGQSFASRFLDQAARCLSMKTDDEGKKEADQLLDSMRNDPDFYTEEMLKKACGGGEPNTKVGRARAASDATSLKENVAPFATSRMTSRFSDYDDEGRDSDEIFRSDGIIVETPTEARGIEEDGPYDSPPARTAHEDGNYSTPSISRLSTVYEESSVGKGGVSKHSRTVCVDSDFGEDHDNDNYDDEDDYHDMMGNDFGNESFYADYRGEFDKRYDDH
jgi:hypothetical protein